MSSSSPIKISYVFESILNNQRMVSYKKPISALKIYSEKNQHYGYDINYKDRQYICLLENNKVSIILPTHLIIKWAIASLEHIINNSKGLENHILSELILLFKQYMYQNVIFPNYNELDFNRQRFVKSNVVYRYDNWLNSSAKSVYDIIYDITINSSNIDFQKKYQERKLQSIIDRYISVPILLRIKLPIDILQYIFNYI